MKFNLNNLETVIAIIEKFGGRGSKIAAYSASTRNEAMTWDAYSGIVCTDFFQKFEYWRGGGLYCAYFRIDRPKGKSKIRINRHFLRFLQGTVDNLLKDADLEKVTPTIFQVKDDEESGKFSLILHDYFRPKIDKARLASIVKKESLNWEVKENYDYGAW